MSVTSSIDIRVSGGASFTAQKSYSGDARLSQSYSVADLATNEVHTIGIDFSELVFFSMNSDQDILVEWNDDSGTQGSVTLLANVPWIEVVAADLYFTGNLITTDITNFRITNASGSTANIVIDGIINNTP